MKKQSNQSTASVSDLSASSGYELELCEGKYALKYTPDGVLWAYRYGEPWRNLVGDNLIANMLWHIQELEARNSKT